MGFNLFAVGKIKPEIKMVLTEFFFWCCTPEWSFSKNVHCLFPCFPRGVVGTFSIELLLSKDTEALGIGRGERIQNGKTKSNSLKKRSGPNFNIKYLQESQISVHLSCKEVRTSMSWLHE